jgi:hypothetical protein
MATSWGRRELQWKDDKLLLGTRNTGAKVIPDAKWPNMYRIEYPPALSQIWSISPEPETRPWTW